jgi:adenylate cyclase
MTGLTKPNQLAIGQMVYDVLDEKQKSAFELLKISPDVWSYVNSQTGAVYNIYSST